MTPEENSTAHSRAQQLRRALQALLIDFRGAERGTVWAPLAKRKIAAEHRDPILGESLCKRYEQR